MSTTPVSVFDSIDHAVAKYESNLSPKGEGRFFYYLVGDSVLIYLERIRLLYIFEIYPRGFYVPPSAAQLPKIVFLRIFRPGGVSMYASSVLIA